MQLLLLSLHLSQSAVPVVEGSAANRAPCLQVGSQPRSVAVVLLKWRREYYESRESCCQKQGNTPGCDCMWDGRTWDNLLPPKAWSRIFTDECDKGPSINRVSKLVVQLRLAGDCEGAVVVDAAGIAAGLQHQVLSSRLPACWQYCYQLR
eukprot:GHRQ01031441.1.p1 GENE.GHRQ01031441.1~~GHRQ01031441.1.p1  ORF type:complete len:150 (-),score=37.60 GHRQ01031441.1:48-497(-)